MKKLCWGIVFMIVLGMIGQGEAQELPPPYDDDVIMVYYEDENPRGLATYFLINNLCLEALAFLNPDLDWANVPYGTKLYLSTDKPCYLYSEDSIYENDVWVNPQRLKFYENGQWLDEPYYADHVIYTYGRPNPKSTFCWDHLLGENYLLAYYLEEYVAIERNTLDVFAPPHMLPCPARTSSIIDVGNNEQLVSHNHQDETILTLKLFAWSPLLFSKTFNICIEEFLLANRELTFHPSNHGRQFLTMRFRKADYLPCYNEQGQRLRYYDDNGQRLNPPVYSDLPVYIAAAGETIEQIAFHFGVCVLDLMRVNQYPRLPSATSVELFIPPMRQCPEIKGVEIDHVVDRNQIPTLSILANTCQDKLIELNPYLSREFDFERRIIASRATKPYLLATVEPCYQQYILQEGESIYDVERQFNVCFEELYLERFSDVIHVPLHAQPCYNELGQRIYYYNQYQFSSYSRGTDGNFNLFIAEPEEKTPAYSSMQVYTLRQSDTVYSISQQFNVCVDDLLKTNIALRLYNLQLGWIGRPIFIPQTRPCYDEETGLPLVYEDELGNLLSEPIVSEHLIYYGAWSHMMPYYYNVCINRIVDANANKYDEKGNARYLGYIIPTDRPPCYDENGVWVDYRLIDKKVHTVTWDDTLSSIGQQYGVPYPLIAWANGLAVNDTIWVGQKLIIPIGARTEDLVWLLGLWAGWFILAIPIYGRHWAKRRHKI